LFCGLAALLKNFDFFYLKLIFMFLDYFDVLMSIFFKKIKYYFDTFSSKKYLKKNHYYNIKYLAMKCKKKKRRPVKSN
jgi:hypothetical protein